MIQDVTRPADIPKDITMLDYRGQDPLEAQRLYPGKTVYCYRRKVAGNIIMIDAAPIPEDLPTSENATQQPQDEKAILSPAIAQRSQPRPAQRQETALETTEAKPTRHTYDSPEGQTIIARIDEISAAASARREACRDPFLRNIKPAAFDWMTEAEREEFHTLQLQIRQTSPAEARARVEARRKARRVQTETEPTPAPRTTPRLSDVIAQLDFFSSETTSQE